MARIGANDPEYHLRREALFLHHKPASKNAVFASVIEPHGGYNYDTEIGSSYSTINKLSTAKSTSEYLVLEMDSKQAGNITVCLALNNLSKNTMHQLETNNDASFVWIGPYYYNITKK